MTLARRRAGCLRGRARRPQAALVKSKAQFRRIVTTAQEGIAQTDAAGVLTFVNQRLADMLGYMPEEMLGQPAYAFLHEEWRALAGAMQERRRAGVAERLEMRLHRKDGNDVWVILAAAPLTDPVGAYGGALFLLTDITERTAAEDALRVTNRALRTLSRGN